MCFIIANEECQAKLLFKLSFTSNTILLCFICVLYSYVLYVWIHFILICVCTMNMCIPAVYDFRLFLKISFICCVCLCDVLGNHFTAGINCQPLHFKSFMHIAAFRKGCVLVCYTACSIIRTYIVCEYLMKFLQQLY